MRSREVERVFAEGRSTHGNRVVLFVAPGSGGTAVVAARKVGTAVERNRARRILRAAWREVAPTVEKGYDVVLVARQGIRGAKTQDLVAEMTELLRRAEAAST
jgi:ribonuclease P protein component